jgi:putative membrane protein
MPGFVVRALIAAAGLWLADRFLPGIEIRGVVTFLLAGLLLGIVNAVVRPVVVFLTLPLTVLTLGLFLFVVNAAMLAFVASLLEQFTISGFFAALLGSVIVSFTAWVASWYIGPKGRVEVLVVRRELA